MSKILKHILVAFHVLVLSAGAPAQNTDTSLVNRKQLRTVIVSESAVALISLSALSVSWYANYDRSSFHFFNDYKEWLQMDKAGHATSAFYISKTSYTLLRWPGIERNRAIWYGGATGFGYLALVELLDGFSEEWGFSPGDFAANTIGSAAFVGQQFAWDEQRIMLKWSYHETGFAHYRPDLLGRNFPERMLKDYNGQTYWLSANIHSFLPYGSRFPKWLNIALGYSAEGMLGGYSNPAEINGNAIPVFERTRQFLLSPDVDLTRIKTRSKTLNMILNFLGFIKIPFPALEYNSKNQWVFHGLYF